MCRSPPRRSVEFRGSVGGAQPIKFQHCQFPALVPTSSNSMKSLLVSPLSANPSPGLWPTWVVYYFMYCHSTFAYVGAHGAHTLVHHCPRTLATPSAPSVGGATIAHGTCPGAIAGDLAPEPPRTRRGDFHPPRAFHPLGLLQRLWLRTRRSHLQRP